MRHFFHRAGLLALILAGGILPAFSAVKAPMGFPSPEAATEALVAASRANETAKLLAILGQAGEKLVRSGDAAADRLGRAHFAAAFDAGHQLLLDGDDKAVLEVGSEQWPFPIPLRKQAGVWRFDAKAGEEEILNRRIGRNELSAIEVCHEYIAAQREFAALRANRGEFIEYAQKLLSSPGRRDGLFWPVEAGDAPSPLGPLMAEARAEGYRNSELKKPHTPYHGYYYKILTRQGPNALGGAHDYIAHGHMIGGFALLAYPERWGDSGVMSFMVSDEGVVYQRNLGTNTATLAAGMASFDPDQHWQAVTEKAGE
ncbi:MAG TPA: DUF2950 domain-containing protein [Stellaceae bacterium]|nr:DUF2950 domain-containing protein [Stellaceae bacterium]